MTGLPSRAEFTAVSVCVGLIDEDGCPIRAGLACFGSVGLPKVPIFAAVMDSWTVGGKGGGRSSG